MLNLVELDKKLKGKSPVDLVELPIVIHVYNFNKDAVKAFEEQMEKAQNSGQEIIPIVIDSYGGEVYSLMTMIDLIKKSKVPVATIVEGKAMSCGAILSTCGKEGMRFIGQHATVMIHDVSSMEMGKAEEIKAGAAEVDRLNNLIYKIIAENCGKSEKYFWDIVQTKGRADWFLTAEEAKEHNLVNHIRIPQFKTKVTVSTVFE